jgi:hypothetical protein
VTPKTSLNSFVFLLLGAWLGAGLVTVANPGAPETVLDLQPFRQAQSISIPSPRGRDGTATFVNLSPTIGAWYLLTITWNNG